MSKPIDLEAIEARANAAAPGPWKWNQAYEVGNSVHWGLESEKESGKMVIDGSLVLLLDSPKWLSDNPPDRANWAFIAHARQDIPALIAELRTARADLELRRSERDYQTDRAEKAEAELQRLREGLRWTKEKPTEGGVYHFLEDAKYPGYTIIFLSGDGQERVRFFNGREEYLGNLRGMFAGPIPQPIEQEPT